MPKRGEIWLVAFDPTVGAEIKKTRPAVVLSSDSLGRLPVKLVAPLTEWKDVLARNLWHLRINPDPINGLAKPSAVDLMQVRSAISSGFIRKLGELSASQMDAIAIAVATVIECP